LGRSRIQSRRRSLRSLLFRSIQQSIRSRDGDQCRAHPRGRRRRRALRALRHGRACRCIEEESRQQPRRHIPRLGRPCRDLEVDGAFAGRARALPEQCGIREQPAEQAD
jgi:hypothetical protein